MPFSPNAADLREIVELLPEPQILVRTRLLGDNLSTIRKLAGDICSECVPHRYAHSLRQRMDEVQSLAHRLE